MEPEAGAAFQSAELEHRHVGYLSLAVAEAALSAREIMEHASIVEISRTLAEVRRGSRSDVMASPSFFQGSSIGFKEAATSAKCICRLIPLLDSFKPLRGHKRCLQE